MTSLQTSSDGSSMQIKVSRRQPSSEATPRPEALDQSPSFENERLLRQFELSAGKSSTVVELFQNISRIICSQSNCNSLWISQKNQQGNFQTVQPLTDENANALWTAIGQVGDALLEHVQQTQQISSVAVTHGCSRLIAAPLNIGREPNRPTELILLGCFSTTAHSLLRLQWLMGIAAQSAAHWYQYRQTRQIELLQRSTGDALSLVAAMDETENNSQTARLVVNQLRSLCQAHQVALTMGGKLMAISDVEQIDVNNENNKIVEQACQQAESTGEPIVFRKDDKQSRAELLAIQTYTRTCGVDGCFNLPLKTHDKRVIGAILIGVSQERLSTEGFMEHVGQLVKLTSGHLDVVMRANQGALKLLISRVRTLTQHRYKKIIIAVAALVAVILAIPVPYRVGCDCSLQPVLRRFVAAPYNGVLEKTLVENGDLVKQGQLLAQMDGRSLRIELAGLEAEFAGARKRRESALAGGEIAQSQIARSEMERLKAEIDLLQEKTRNLEVVSPIDGIVVSGDLEKVEGAPLEMGQTLFEIAPLEEMVAEVAIPESEIGYVREGMDVAIKLSAFPFEKFTGQLKNIHPRAEIYEDDSVFIAQVVLPNDSVELRPGMKGSAKVNSIWAPLGWNLFHRSFEAVRYWMIW